MKKSLPKLFLIVIFVAVPVVSFSQGPPPPPPGLPVDGGLIFLILTGLIYGVFKLKRGN